MVMNVGFFNRVKRYVAIFLVALVGLLTLNNALFIHIHNLPDGNIVVHAHPFLASSQPNSANNPTNHQHTKVEFHVLDSLMLLFTFCIVAYLISVLVGEKKYFFPCVSVHFNRTPRLLTNKAPPVLA